jgi:peptide/nickel transport system ATP-binding protein
MLELQEITVRYGSRRSALTAVDKVSLSIGTGESVGLVGESGSGKSSLARAIVGLVRVRGGRIVLDANDVTNARGKSRRYLRRRVQLVFQDPYSSLNPRITIGESIDEAIKAHRHAGRSIRISEAVRLLELVRLDPSLRARYPHQLSGGERQRIAIARALAAQPEVLVLDEVTSGLDVSVQANILNILKELQRELGLTYLLISHNLSVVRYMCDRIAVMYMARIVESAPTYSLFMDPRHPYTRTLIDSIPRVHAISRGPILRAVGEVPDPRNPPSGCRFRTRCPLGPVFYPNRVRCIEVDPLARVASLDHSVACHFPLDQFEADAGTSQPAPSLPGEADSSNTKLSGPLDIASGS